MSEIHPLVRSTVARLAAQSAERTEAIRSSRNSSSTTTPGGQSRALALGKRLRELESVTASWGLVLDLVSLAELESPSDPPKKEEPFFWRGKRSGLLYCAHHTIHPALATRMDLRAVPEGAVCGMCERRLKPL
jgi:hypothetical protein